MKVTKHLNWLPRDVAQSAPAGVQSLAGKALSSLIYLQSWLCLDWRAGLDDLQRPLLTSLLYVFLYSYLHKVQAVLTFTTAQVPAGLVWYSVFLLVSLWQLRKMEEGENQ